MAAPTGHDLESIALFADLSDTDRDIVASWLDSEIADAGRHLTHQGAHAYAFYVLRSGTADVDIDGRVVANLGAGDFFGELAMVGAGVQTATVTVTEAAEVWTMFGTRFRELQMQYADIAATIERAAQTRSTNV